MTAPRADNQVSNHLPMRTAQTQPQIPVPTFTAVRGTTARKTIFPSKISVISQMAETTQMSTNGLMDKQNVVNLRSGILISHEKEWCIDMYYNMDESWKHYVNQVKETSHRNHIIYDSTYTKMSRIGQALDT